MLHAVIPAGGSGTRLWPLSRAGHPKFLHALTGAPQTLIQATVARLEPVTTPERTYIVTGAGHAAAVARQVPLLPDDNILVEPAPKDSCAAIGLAAALIAHRDPGALMGAFSADHIVRDQRVFTECVHAAVAGARDGRLMVFGITPTRPETGYGYVACDAPAGPGPVRPVTEFTEKPSADVAVRYVESGRYFWNASMFVWQVEVFLSELRRQQPALHEGLTEIAAAWDGPHRQRVLDRVWPVLPRISVDFAVMEGAAARGLVAAVPSDFGWTDVGDFHTLGETLAASPEDNVVLGGQMSPTADRKAPVVLQECAGMVVVPHSGRLVAGVGLQDLIIVDTADAVLVCPRSRAQDVKRVVNRLADEGHEDYL